MIIESLRETCFTRLSTYGNLHVCICRTRNEWCSYYFGITSMATICCGDATGDWSKRRRLRSRTDSLNRKANVMQLSRILMPNTRRYFNQRKNVYISPKIMFNSINFSANPRLRSAGVINKISKCPFGKRDTRALASPPLTTRHHHRPSCFTGSMGWKMRENYNFRTSNYAS